MSIGQTFGIRICVDFQLRYAVSSRRHKWRTSFEVKKEPTVTEVEVRKLAVLIQMFKQFWIQHL